MSDQLPDGYPLGNGVVVYNDGKYCHGVYRCKCGREQTAQNPIFPGGISPKAAELIGFRRINGEWECPFCTGNTSNLL